MLASFSSATRQFFNVRPGEGLLLIGIVFYSINAAINCYTAYLRAQLPPSMNPGILNPWCFIGKHAGGV
jgi:hypothetical protein